MQTFEVHTLDLQYQDALEAIAAYLVHGPAGYVLVETGPGSTLKALERELARFGVTPAQIQAVLVTHIHLDHAGAAGWWAQRGVPIYVHYVGAPHLKDPSKLLASANRIYGDKMQTLWGDFLPVPEAQLHVLHGGDVIDVVGLKFTALDTPGHAYHHMTYRLGDVAFTGDVAGVRISGRQRMRIPSPPPEFDLEAWHASVAKLREQKFTRLYLTHFGVVNDVEAHWANVDRLLDEVTDLIREGMAQGGTRDNLIELYEYWESTRRYTGLLEPAQANSMLAGSGSLGMQIDGLVRYWTKKQQKQA